MQKTVKTSFYAASVVTALCAAALWWWSAAVPIPEPTWAGLGRDGDFMIALNHSARLNALAAVFTGVSVLLSILSAWPRKSQAE